ncbi:MAG TPA: 16S rRNA (guanine(966)-N(2))-methyltransferase RsmD [Steroidobacteraceae bacterium]|nr:16S rRNA (guanine(966)-N(2))-methyltransferase RsmD [Steroidobacteraceae bacterium]
MAKEKNTRKSRASARADDAGIGARTASGHSRILRIIAGRHRGRRLRFPAGVEIRPTPDRVRETLFNWLQPRMDQARVLDLFAGSGALGLEALSRGAAQVTFIEKDRRAAAAIEAVTREWQEANARVVCASALTWLAAPVSGPHFDIVFLDPPYDSDLLAAAAKALVGRLAPDARVYLESRARDSLPELPASWKELRAGKAGEVGYHLFSV